MLLFICRLINSSSQPKDVIEMKRLSIIPQESAHCGYRDHVIWIIIIPQDSTHCEY